MRWILKRWKMDGIILKTNELIFQNNERNGRKEWIMNLIEISWTPISNYLIERILISISASSLILKYWTIPFKMVKPGVLDISTFKHSQKSFPTKYRLYSEICWQGKSLIFPDLKFLIDIENKEYRTRI